MIRTFTALILGVLLGMAWQHALTGWHASRNQVKQWPFPLGFIRLEHVNESVGWQPGAGFKSRIVLLPQQGVSVILFECETETFKDVTPSVEDVTIDGQVLRFTDGQRSYELQIKKE